MGGGGGGGGGAVALRRCGRRDFVGEISGSVGERPSCVDRWLDCCERTAEPSLRRKILTK